MKMTLQKLFFLLIVFCFNPCFGNGPPVPGNAPPPPPGMPIDNNIFILLIIAIGYGLFVLYPNKNNKKGLTD
jgi:hypothetical protein